jgi:hypothetical protein
MCVSGRPYSDTTRSKTAARRGALPASSRPGFRLRQCLHRIAALWSAHCGSLGEAQEILKASPEQQVVGNDDALSWRAVNLSRSNSELDSLVKLLKTIRNNPFHGGKHAGAGWDDVPSTKTLLQSGLVVLEQLAALDAVLEADFAGLY